MATAPEADGRNGENRHQLAAWPWSDANRPTDLAGGGILGRVLEPES